MSPGPAATVAEVQIPSDADAPVTFDIEVHALKLALVDRRALKVLDAKTWDEPGVYVLIGPLGTEATEVYIGKAGGGKQGVRGRLMTHSSSPTKNSNFSWWRAVAILRDTTDGFNSAQIGYLEGRIASELGSLPSMKVRSDRGDLDTSLSEIKRATLDEFMPSVLAGLKLAGLPMRQEKPESEDKLPTGKRHYGASVSDLVAKGDLEVGAVLTYKHKGHIATATVTANGSLLVDGVAYKTPSEAGKAAHQLKNRPRGWTDWKLAGGEGKSLHELREDYLSKVEA